tara:strand:- start:510 stop:761 length:252 start_codon:yes stop_codon:yes gene_type:complete
MIEIDGDFDMQLIIGDEVISDFLHPLGAMVLVEPDTDGRLRLSLMGNPDTDAGITAMTMIEAFIELAHRSGDTLETMPVEGSA